jgi:hypothetical protein
MGNRRGWPRTRVVLSPSERATLEQWVRRRSTAQGMALRARIVLEPPRRTRPSRHAAALQWQGRFRGRPPRFAPSSHTPVSLVA